MLSLSSVSQIYGSIASYDYSNGSTNSSPSSDAASSTSAEQDASNIRNGVQNQVNSAVAYAQSDPYTQSQLSNADSTIVSLSNGADTYGSSDTYNASGVMSSKARVAESAVQQANSQGATYVSKSAQTTNEAAVLANWQASYAANSGKQS
jgi:hypothetical protein